MDAIIGSVIFVIIPLIAIGGIVSYMCNMNRYALVLSIALGAVIMISEGLLQYAYVVIPVLFYAIIVWNIWISPVLGRGDNA